MNEKNINFLIIISILIILIISMILFLVNHHNKISEGLGCGYSSDDIGIDEYCSHSYCPDYNYDKNINIKKVFENE